MIGIKNRLQEAHSKSQFIPTGNQTIYGDALDQINELEHERDQLREHVKMLRDALLTCSVGDFSTGHVIHPSFDEKLVEEALAATEQQSPLDNPVKR